MSPQQILPPSSQPPLPSRVTQVPGAETECH
ncbi:hypothetical protein E2C01_041664 [Portunus trituberculatus]|uniref:Uncharacterized protein n=1 Tax=Portunus trituberculatus TaxID=210409 RepID=A0A5B7FSB3_PORTR|nr:hypothetical protein [Portunus trituberculatus]